MSAIDDFADSLLEEAKRFLEKAKTSTDPVACNAYLHAALMLAFCSLEAHVHSISDDFLLRPEVTPHEKGILLERDVRLEKGEFVLTSNLKMVRLEDRIQFLHVRFSGKPFDHSQSWWSELGNAVKLRNELTHPKKAVVITPNEIGRAVQAIIDTLDSLFTAIYKRRFPQAGLGLDSRLTFD